MTIQRIAIMTGGGDCPGLNPVVRAAVTTAVRGYGWSVLGIEDAYSGLLNLSYRSPRGNVWLRPDDVEDILDRGGTILGTSNRSDPFHYAVERDGEQIEIDIFDRVLENFAKLKLDALISVGGDGSMAIAQRSIERGLTRIVGVPKTIDNDLGATDYTFGFDTAVQVATEAVDRLRDTAESHDRVMLVEVMGRDAGFIAMHAGLAGGAHAILLPEIPYRVEAIAGMIRRRRADGHFYSIIVVAEGAKPVGGEASVQEPRKVGAMRKLSGAAQRVADGLARLVDADMRVTVLGHLQRGGSPSNFDRLLGTRMGQEAVHMIARGEFGRMVALRGTELVTVPISEAIGNNKRIELDGQLVATARSLGVCLGDEA